MPLYNIEAFVLKSRPFGEADKLLTLFSRTQGKINAIAKGARKPTSKFGGRLEVFSLNKFLLASARNLDIISQCETIENFYRLREDSERLMAGAYFFRLADLTTEEKHADEEMFDLLLESLYDMQKSYSSAQQRRFEVMLCEIEGFMPTAEMLEKRHKGLSVIAEKLKDVSSYRNMPEKELEAAGKVFQMIISEHIGLDVRRLKVAI